MGDTVQASTDAMKENKVGGRVKGGRGVILNEEACRSDRGALWSTWG